MSTAGQFYCDICDQQRPDCDLGLAYVLGVETVVCAECAEAQVERRLARYEWNYKGPDEIARDVVGDLEERAEKWRHDD